MSDSKKEQTSKPVWELVDLGSVLPTFDMPVTVPSDRDGRLYRFVVQCDALTRSEWAAQRDAAIRRVMEANVARELSTTATPAEPLPQSPAKGKKSAAQASAPAAEPVDVAVQRIIDEAVRKNGQVQKLSGAVESNGALILAFAKSWTLQSTPCDAAGLAALEDRIAGALVAIVEAYDVAIHQGRLGN